MDYLKDWVTLNQHIMELPEKKLQQLLLAEKDGPARFTFLVRIQGRINKLRARRERQELMKGK